LWERPEPKAEAVPETDQRILEYQMRTETEIVALPLVERQKLWVEMKQVPTGDRDFANAKAIVTVIEDTEDWEAPEQKDVVATDNTIVDGKAVKKGETVKVYEWQFAALRRHLAIPEELEARKARKKAAGSAGAAAMLIGFLMLFGFTASAQNQTYVIGGPGTYNVVSIAGLYGGTNNVMGTNSTFGTAVITTNTAVVPNWTSVNGVYTNAPTTNVVSITTNIAGAVSLANMDMADIVFGAQLTAAGTSTATAMFDASDDLVTWQSNKFSLTLVMAGTSYLSTNYGLTLVPNGYVRLNYVSYPSTTVALTNLTVTLAKKPGRTGP
jgi:hypothetical protein